MSQRKKSKEELYICALYELVKREGDLQASFDRYEVGSVLGYHKKATDTTVQILTRNNFIKKEGDCEIFLTGLGIELAESIRES